MGGHRVGWTDNDRAASTWDKALGYLLRMAGLNDKDLEADLNDHGRPEVRILQEATLGVVDRVQHERTRRLMRLSFLWGLWKMNRDEAYRDQLTEVLRIITAPDVAARIQALLPAPKPAERWHINVVAQRWTKPK